MTCTLLVPRNVHVAAFPQEANVHGVVYIRGNVETRFFGLKWCLKVHGHARRDVGNQLIFDTLSELPRHDAIACIATC